MKTCKAFTLLELMLTLCIGLILCSMAIPHFMNRNQHQLMHELERLEVIFYYLQQRAIATNVAQELILDPVSQTYAYRKNNQLVTYRLAPNVSFGFISGVLGPPSQPIKPIASALVFAQYAQEGQKAGLFSAKILPSGKISPGTLYLTDKTKNVMGALTCGVSRVSYIRRYLYQSQEWILLTP